MSDEILREKLSILFEKTRNGVQKAENSEVTK